MSLSYILDIRGYSRYRRDLGRTTQLINRYLDYTCFEKKSIISGGKAECSMIAGSDSDVMEVVNLFNVMETNNMSDAYSTSETKLQESIPAYISRKHCNEGYCRLEICTFSLLALLLTLDSREEIEPNETVSNFIYKNVLRITQEHNGRYYISSKLFHDDIIPVGFVNPDNPNGPQFVSNGPAMTCENVDAVICLQLGQWPTEAKKWSSRERQNNWPNKELLSDLEKNVSCYVVPIGSKSSKESYLEWRFSFVEIELNLIWNMNDTQFKCFVLLKALNRTYMQDKLSTYHIKNVAFWLCEELPETDWKKDLLVTCVKIGLQKLRQYIKDGHLPHYIVPNNNLFLNKSIREPDEKKHALKLLDGICNGLEDKLFKLFGNEKQNLFEYTVLLPACPSFCQSLNKYRESLTKTREYCKRCHIILQFVEFRNSQSICANMDKLFGQDGEDILPCIRLAISKFERKSSKTDNEIDDFITKMKKESEIDYLTVALTCGMTYFMHSRYLDVRKALIRKLKDGSNKSYITLGGKHLYMCLKSGDITDIEITSEQVEDILTQTYRHNLVMDVAVCHHELEYVPFPLQLQLSLCGPRKTIYCNPLVLSCYMMYISEYNLELCEEMKKTREVFENVVSKTSHLPFHYIHLNLLGHSLYVTGERKSAFEYFVMSTKAHPYLTNAVLYHIACMLNDIVQKKCAPLGN